MISELEIKSPVMDGIHTLVDTVVGTPIPQLTRLETFDPGTWEDITLEFSIPLEKAIP